LTVTTALIAALVASAAPARAAFPGDNGKIAFDSTRDTGGTQAQIYTMFPDGAAQTRITNDTLQETAAAWSPDGSRIAFESRTGIDIWVMNSDGTGKVQLTSGAVNDRVPTWSPDGTKITFNSNRDGPTGGGRYEVYTMNPDGSAQTRLTHKLDNPNDNAGGPVWSPGGTKIAFVALSNPVSGNRQAMWTINPDGTGLTQLFIEPSPLVNAALGFFDWSPDGSKFVVDVGWPSVPANREIATMNADGTGLTRLTTNTADDGYPKWSPDGKKIVFDTNRDRGSGAYDIYTMNADGSNQTRLTFATGTSGTPAWQRSSIYVRPKGGSPFYASLVPAYQTCSSPNRVHGAPLAYSSCNPPAQSSPNLTVGTPDANLQGAKSVSHAKLLTLTGDIQISADITDVRNTSDLSDYTGTVQLVLPIQITDRNSPGTGGVSPIATTESRDYTATFPCGATPDTTIGSECSVSTSANVLTPGAVIGGQRTMWEVNQIKLLDGGPDGDATTANNSVFMVQGVFAP
jgi:Tol biopolymer transport system component